MVRFRFGNEGNLVSDGDDPGWFIDEIELIDLNSYSSAACVSSDQDPNERCTVLQTTVINSTSTTSINPDISSNELKVYPNPVNELLTISSDSPLNGNIQLQSAGGRMILQRNIRNSKYIVLEVSNVPPGMYFLNIMSGNSRKVEKIIITE
jgi:hypothetical protein